MFNLNGPIVTLYDVQLVSHRRGMRIRYDDTVKREFSDATMGLQLKGLRSRAAADAMLAEVQARVPDHLQDKCEVREYSPL